MIIAEIKLYELLKAKIGEKEAEAFVQILETNVDKQFEDKQQIFKDDIKSLKEYMDKSFATKEDLARVEGGLESKIAETKADIIKWMFIFWVGQIGVLIGIIAIFFKK